MLRLIVILAILAIGGTAALFSRFSALLFYLWFAIFRPQEWLWIDISRYRPSLAIGALVVVPALLTGIWPNLSHPLSLGAVAFFATALQAQRNAVAPAFGWYWLDFLAKLILIGLFLVSLTFNRRRLVWIVAVISGSFALHSAKAGLVSALGGFLRFEGGLSGAFSDNNAYGVGSVMVLYLLVAAAQNVPFRWMRGVFWVAVPLTMVTVVSTFSRAAFLGFAGSAVVFVLLQRRRLLLGALLAVVVISGISVLPIGYTERLATIGSYEEVGEQSAMSRLHFWRVALVMARQNPMGIGLWNFQANYDRYDFLNGRYGRSMAVHNSHLQVLTETGWLGAAIWLFLLSWALVTCFRVRRRSMRFDDGSGLAMVSIADGLLCSIVAFVVGGFFSSMAYNDITWLTFATVAAMDRISLQEARQTPERAEAQTTVDVSTTLIPENTWRPPGRRS